MKLTVAQSGVLMAIAVMMLLLMADVFGLINLSTVIIVTTSLILAIIARQVLPSLEELEQMTRRR